MSRHTIEAEINISPFFAGDPDLITVLVTYDYIPAQRAYTPRGEYAPIDPPEPEAVEYVTATLIDSKDLSLSEQSVEKWAIDWLDGEGYGEACYHATRGQDPDEARDEARERAYDRDRSDADHERHRDD